MDSLRVDKWLWYARFFKTRTLASQQVAAGHVRVNGTKISKPSTNVAVGDILTFVQAKRIRVVKVEVLAERRGPAPEAAALYTDMTPQTKPDLTGNAERKGRPTKKDRRAIDKTVHWTLE